MISPGVTVPVQVPGHTTDISSVTSNYWSRIQWRMDSSGRQKWSSSVPQQEINQHQQQHQQQQQQQQQQQLSILDGLRLGESPYLHPLFLHLATSGMERNPAWNIPPLEQLEHPPPMSKTKTEEQQPSPAHNQAVVQDMEKSSSFT